MLKWDLEYLLGTADGYASLGSLRGRCQEGLDAGKYTEKTPV